MKRLFIVCLAIAQLFAFSSCTHEHQWNNGTITKAATCVEDGILTRTCIKCKETQTEIIPKTNEHKWANRTIEKTATCGEEGICSYTCSVCHEKKTESIAKTSNHSWGAKKYDITPSWQREGKYTIECKVCHEKQQGTESYFQIAYDDIKRYGKKSGDKIVYSTNSSTSGNSAITTSIFIYETDDTSTPAFWVELKVYSYDSIYRQTLYSIYLCFTRTEYKGIYTVTYYSSSYTQGPWGETEGAIFNDEIKRKKTTRIPLLSEEEEIKLIKDVYIQGILGGLSQIWNLQ